MSFTEYFRNDKNKLHDYVLEKLAKTSNCSVSEMSEMIEIIGVSDEFSKVINDYQSLRNSQ